MPFGTAALHKNDEQKKWLLKECDGDGDVLFVYMKIPANAGQSGTTSALSVVLKSDRLSRKIVLILLLHFPYSRSLVLVPSSQINRLE